jgi:hypothetical protein
VSTAVILFIIFAAITAWGAALRVSDRRKAENAARAAYYQRELDAIAKKRRAEDRTAAMVRSTQQIAREAEEKYLAAVERRERYY